VGDKLPSLGFFWLPFRALHILFYASLFFVGDKAFFSLSVELSVSFVSLSLYPCIIVFYFIIFLVLHWQGGYSGVGGVQHFFQLCIEFITFSIGLASGFEVLLL
jgi:hypothetical protein